MLKSLASLGILAYSFIILGITGQKNVGPGKWSVLNVMKCDNDDLMRNKLDCNRRKINRTHDGFNCNITLKEPLDEKYAIRIHICKMVQGGCKDYNTLADNSLINFMNKYAENNTMAALENMGLDKQFPMPKGTHCMKNFIMNYDDLPDEGPYGEFFATAYMLEDATEVACIIGHCKFEEQEEEDEE